MKNALPRILPAVLCLTLTTAVAAQSGKDSPRYKQQHKAAQHYQKNVLKMQRKQQKQDAKRAKAFRKQHDLS